MKLKTITKLTALVLCLCMLCACATPFEGYLAASRAAMGASASSAPNAGSTVPPKAADEDRRTIPYSEMEYVRPDVEGMKALIEEKTAQLSTAASYDEAMAISGELEAMYANYSTMYTLAMLKGYQDISDTYFNEEYRVLEEADADLTLLVNAFNEKLLQSEWSDELRDDVGDYVYENLENSLLFENDVTAQYTKERGALTIDYTDWYAELTVESDGEEYLYDDILMLGDAEKRAELEEQYYDKYADQYASLLARLVQLDNLSAEELGFASAPEVYYALYQRTYTPSDALELFDNIREYIFPVLFELPTVNNDKQQIDLDKALSEMPSALNVLSPEIKDIFNYMLEYELCDLDARENKNTVIQFTTLFQSYDAPFMFTNWGSDVYSVTTLVHEFGHFSNLWMNGLEGVNNNDITEIYSQGLELLMTPLFDNLVDDVAGAELEIIYNIIVNGLLFQSALEEFQIKLYELETINNETVSALYGETMYKYMLAYSNAPDNSWISIAHIFTQPFYTGSYVTSALAALQIWAIAQDDWQTGVDTYMNMINANQEQSFDDLLAEAGLAPVHAPETLEEITTKLLEFFAKFE